MESSAASSVTQDPGISRGAPTPASPQPSKSLPARGAFPDTLLRDAIAWGWVSASSEIPEENIQPASLDLRLGAVAYRLRSSFLPGDQPVTDSLRDYQLGAEIPLAGGAVLEKDRPYLIPLMESLNLPDDVKAQANPRSSTGRLDIFTRILVDRTAGFDHIPQGYAGPMYLEVVPRSFTIHIAEGLSLSQIRLIYGDNRISDEDLMRRHLTEPLLYSYSPLRAASRVDTPVVSSGLFLTVDLMGDSDKVVGYRAKKNSALLDLSKINHYRVEDFWERVESDPNSRLILEPEEFYLLASVEGVAVPADWNGEMTAFDPTSGELRTHYAGFFDPGFGRPQDGGEIGSRAVLEVRAHDVPFALRHGQKIARLEFEPMMTPPSALYGSEIESSYQHQGLKLSKHFKEPIAKTQYQKALFPEYVRNS